MTWEIRRGNSNFLLQTMDDDSVDSVVTDPPYALISTVKRWANSVRTESTMPKNPVYARVSAGFMGQKWDTGDTAFDPQFWADVLRVLKPGGHVLAFSGTRTYHRLACAIEDAGFEIRDQIGWLYGSGFPKSHDVSKGVDRHLGAEREKIRVAASEVRNPKATGGGRDGTEGATRPWIEEAMARGFHEKDGDAPATAAAAAWHGWGTALKPAWEPIVVARKPLDGTVAENVLAHGTGAINIDGCRVDGPSRRSSTGGTGRKSAPVFGAFARAETQDIITSIGRWPANIIHDGSDEVVSAFPDAPGQIADASQIPGARKTQNVYGAGEPSAESENEGDVGFKMKPGARRLDEGSAARFFYCAKASKKDRGAGNIHPTVKPTELTRYLCRLVTRPGGLVLDPFAGSGSTGKAAVLEGFNFIGMEMSTEYADIAEARIREAEMFS